MPQFTCRPRRRRAPTLPRSAAAGRAAQAALWLLVLLAGPVRAQTTGVISGRVTQSDGVTPVTTAGIQVFRNAALVGSASTNGSGNYTIAGLTAGAYALQCSAPGYMTYINSPVNVSAGATTTVGVSLPPATPVSNGFTNCTVPGVCSPAKEYIYAGSRLVATEESSQGTTFLQFTGSNSGTVALPPLTLGVATFSGGQIFPHPSGLWNYTEYGIVGATAIAIDFAQPVFNLEIGVDGVISSAPETFTIQDDKGGQYTVGPYNGGSFGGAIHLVEVGIRRVTITSSAAHPIVAVNSVYFTLVP